jgi:hypothetical protein
LGELRWPSAIMRSISPILFASSLAWLTMCTKNGNARSGTDIKMVRCFSAVCAGPSAANARPRADANLIILEYLIEFFFLIPPCVGLMGERDARTITQATPQENAQIDKFIKITWPWIPLLSIQAPAYFSVSKRARSVCLGLSSPQCARRFLQRVILRANEILRESGAKGASIVQRYSDTHVEHDDNRRPDSGSEPRSQRSC